MGNPEDAILGRPEDLPSPEVLWARFTLLAVRNALDSTLDRPNLAAIAEAHHRHRIASRTRASAAG